MRGKKFKVKYNYIPVNVDELELNVGDVVELISEIEEGWWEGKLKNKVICVVQLDNVSNARSRPIVSLFEFRKSYVLIFRSVSSHRTSSLKLPNQKHPRRWKAIQRYRYIIKLVKVNIRACIMQTLAPFWASIGDAFMVSLIDANKMEVEEPKSPTKVGQSNDAPVLPPKPKPGALIETI